jgi:hypothetical protein
MRDRRRFSDEEIRRANGVSLLDLARSYGFELDESTEERRAYHAKRSGGLFFFKDNNKFKHFSSDAKGGPIDFVMFQERITFVEAVKKLLGQNNEFVNWSAYEPSSGLKKKEKRDLILPKRAASCKRAYWYLVSVRGIDPKIVSALIAEKKIYQSEVFVREQSRYESVCAFVGYDENDKARYCFIRGADPNSPVKRDRAGSEKAIPFHIAGGGNRVYVFESPIDAMSHATISQIQGVDWRQDHRISTGTISDAALRWFLAQHPEIQEICWCYDNDRDGIRPQPISQTEYDAAISAGDTSAYIRPSGGFAKNIPYNYGLEAAQEFAIIYRDLGYRTYVHEPVDKDFNADLQLLRRETVELMADLENGDDMEC